MPERGVKPHASFLALCGLALRLVLRRFPLFATATAIAIGLQALLAIVWRVPHAVLLGSFVVLPILTTLVYAFVAADTRPEPMPAAAAWERFLERSWAVVIIDFVLAYIGAIGLSGASSAAPVGAIVGILALGLSAALVFTDAAATVDDDVTVASVIPHAFVRGLTTAWRWPIFPRAIAIFSIQLIVYALENATFTLLQHRHVAEPEFWSQVPILTLVVPPLAALTGLVYLDANEAGANRNEDS
ncbi:MAG TPA: hypothetical protein VIJ77_05035 [Candidatus Tumulicola sp.]